MRVTGLGLIRFEVKVAVEGVVRVRSGKKEVGD